MQEQNKNIDYLFTKAKKADVKISVEQVRLGIAVSAVAGATATIGIISKLKFNNQKYNNTNGNEIN